MGTACSAGTPDDRRFAAGADAPNGRGPPFRVGTDSPEVVELRAVSVLAGSFGVYAIARTSKPAEVRAKVEVIQAEAAVC
jgi:hypothetical protein